MDYDVAVVGAGVLGSSVARRLADDVDVCVLDKEHHLGLHQSGRNSGVLHPGYNYEPGTPKAEYAPRGTRRAKEYAADKDVAVDEHGVYVTARDESEIQVLELLLERAEANGVEARLVDGDEMREVEPHAAGVAALHAPEAASIDSVAYLHSLARDAVSRGARLHLGHELRGVERGDGRRWRLETSCGGVEADYVVGCAGLQADRVARLFDVGSGYRVVPFRGEYYELSPDAENLCRTMIYPAPDPELPFLGVHYTRRTDGKVVVGPNAVLAFGREAYANHGFDVRDMASTFGYAGFWRLMASRKMLGVAWSELNKSYRKKRFVEAARSLVPDAEPQQFHRSYSGVRAQLVSRDGELVDQPLVEHGEASTHVLNAVSPGLTTSLPYGEDLAIDVLERL
ncbi:MAG: L-2-hydroxyglutarate oxidase [Halobacteriales archaeon]